MFESIFEALFKYRPFFFRQGEFSLQWGLELWQVAVLAFGLGGLVWLIYRRRWSGPLGWALFGLRSAVLVLLVLIAMRPTLVLSTLVPRENMLAVLVDNSKSMGIRDQLEPRGLPLKPLLEPESDFVKALEEKFYVRPYRFAAQAESSKLPIALDWAGDQTNIVAALERVAADSVNLPLAGIVLLSDGSDNSYSSFNEITAELQAREIPVYVVGIGPEAIENDVEMTQVTVSRRALPESVISARVTLRHNGFGGSRGRLEVREGNSLVQATEVRLPRDSDTHIVEVPLSPKAEGVKDYHFTLQPLEGERIAENNTRSAIVEVEDSRPRILYVEGHPRWEYKFLRQALQRDRNIRLETLLRTAHNKFYRQGIEEETTLAAGFPSEREELFEYKGIIFGSVESAFFTYAQMELVKDFVSERGGGFLMLGGSNAYSSGNYQNTPIEQMLPVWLPQEDGVASLYKQGEARFVATAHGERHPALNLSLTDQENRQKWAGLPMLTDWNTVRSVKPGTTVLAQLQLENADRDSGTLLAFHRFGRGQALALLSGSSWRWQMLQEAKDQTHETFWRQMMRWLVVLAKDPVSVETERESYARNENIQIRSEVSDASFNRLNDARVEAVLTSPSGKVERFPLHWSASEDGVYKAEWQAAEDGLHRIDVEARTSDDTSVADQPSKSFFQVSTGTREYFTASQRVDFLKRLAEETGGRYYNLDNIENLPEEIVYTEKQASSVEVLDLWDMPINLLFLMGLLGAEWVLRKRSGAI